MTLSAATVLKPDIRKQIKKWENCLCNALQEGLFRRAGRQNLRRKILKSIKKGEKPHFQNIENSAVECAAALQLFLSHLKKPVIPQHVQELILADNPGVAARIVARDAMGLIRQDVRGRHGELLADLLDLLRHLTLSGPPSERSELQGSPLPIALLPVFFTLTPADLIKWKKVASRFNELITVASEQLRTNNEHSNNMEYEPSNNTDAITSSSEQLARLRELSLLYPIIRLTNGHIAHELGEMTQVLAAPLRHIPAGRLHPIISYSSR